MTDSSQRASVHRALDREHRGKVLVGLASGLALVWYLLWTVPSCGRQVVPDVAVWRVRSHHPGIRRGYALPGREIVVSVEGAAGGARAWRWA